MIAWKEFQELFMLVEPLNILNLHNIYLLVIN